MAEEKRHHHLFGSHKEEEEKSISDDVALSGGSDAFDGGDYSSENIGGRYSHTIEETDEKDEKDQKHKEHLGEIDALAADDLDLYEKEEAKKGPAPCCQKRNIEKEASTTIGVSPTGCAFNERHEKKEAKEDDDDEEDEEEAEGKKKEHLF